MAHSGFFGCCSLHVGQLDDGRSVLVFYASHPNLRVCIYICVCMLSNVPSDPCPVVEIKAPENVWKLIKQFWDSNHDKAKAENWGVGNTYTNNWKVPTKMVSVEDSGLRGGGSGLKQKIWNAAKETIQEWTGQELTQCSLYGVRIYYEGSVLAPHVDRLPLVSSAIINVAQDEDGEP
jgi:hypothetical protein